MVRILTFAIIGICLFGAGLGASWMLMGSRSAVGALPEDENLAAVLPTDPDADVASVETPEGIEANELPVPFHGAPVSAEDLFRFGATFRNQQEALKQREAELNRERKQIKLIKDDIRGSQMELDGLRAEIQDVMKAADELVGQVQQHKQELLQQRQDAQQELKDIKENRTQYDDEEAKNVKKISAWLQDMPTGKVAEYLSSMVNQGKIDFAVKLLGNMEERDVAKILSEFPEDEMEVVIELTDRSRGLVRPAEKKRR